ncbi:hypothetical protein EP331_13515 [bacterium]|nr:MAG: hypothetical protein EP331_13515 [bacterium]
MQLRPLAKTPKHKRFDYIPRYWKPEEEEKAKRLKYGTIHFERKTRRGQAKSIIMYALILSMILYLMVTF